MKLETKSDGGREDEEKDSRTGSKRRLSAVALIIEVTTGKKGFTKRQWTMLIFFAVIDFFAAITISMQAPFYPEEAESKGATAAEYGLVFGVFEFMLFLVSPIYGRYMNQIGPKTLFSISIIVNSLAVVCFGMMDWIDDHTWFITLSFICRIVEGLGCAGFFTSTFVLIACEFPDSVATIFASLETFIGLGLICGPTLGGILNELGGFPLPFFSVGACLFLTGVSSVLVMPKIDKAKMSDGTDQQGYGIWAILKIPSVALAALTIMSTAMSLGFVSATLEPHIRRFDLSPLQTGLVFIVNGGTYAITAPISGYICDKIKRPAYIAILGNVFICISFMLIGPAIFIPGDTILSLSIVGLFLQGLGFSCCFTSAFIISLRESMANGFPDNVATYGVISGLWQATFSLGAWIGPSAGGFLFDLVGFRQGSWLILVMSFIAGMTIVIYQCIFSPSSSNEESPTSTNAAEESQPLLQQQQQQQSIPSHRDFEESCAVRPSQSSSSYGSTPR